MILAKKEQLDMNILNTWKYSSPLYFHPFRPRPHCEWTNLGMVKFRCLNYFSLNKTSFDRIQDGVKMFKGVDG